MSAEQQYSFDSLAGISPGTCSIAEAVSKFGYAEVSGSSDGGFFHTFTKHGVRVCTVDNETNPRAIIDEVALLPNYTAKLSCGLHLGQSKESALKLVRTTFDVEDDYEDAIYFYPSTKRDLLCSVEFMEKDLVVLIELLVEFPKKS